MLGGKDGSFVREACRDRAVNHLFICIVHQPAHACAKNRRKKAPRRRSRGDARPGTEGASRSKIGN